MSTIESVFVVDIARQNEVREARRNRVPERKQLSNFCRDHHLQYKRSQFEMMMYYKRDLLNQGVYFSRDYYLKLFLDYRSRYRNAVLESKKQSESLVRYRQVGGDCRFKDHRSY